MSPKDRLELKAKEARQAWERAVDELGKAEEVLRVARRHVESAVARAAEKRKAYEEAVRARADLDFEEGSW